jgi:hypothetical protein
MTRRVGRDGLVRCCGFCFLRMDGSCVCLVADWEIDLSLDTAFVESA